MSQLSLGEPSATAAGGSNAGGSPDVASPTLKLVVAYDGTDFHGFAAQPGERTVAGVLAGALAKPLHSSLPETGAVITCAGRTDTGVHAWGQVLSVPLADAARIDPARLVRAVNGMLAPEVVVRAAEVVEGGFDARRDATWRRYHYTVVNRPVPDPFRDRFAWWVPEELDLARLRLAVDPFLGEHDFAAFCRKGPEGRTTVRRVLDAGWVDAGDGVLRFEIRATAFCHRMVRSVVGTVVDAGAGRLRPGDILAILHSLDRANAGRVAPPRGLCLWDVGYGAR